MICGGPFEDGREIRQRGFRVDNSEIHWATSLRASSLDTKRPASASRIPRSIASSVSWSSGSYGSYGASNTSGICASLITSTLLHRLPVRNPSGPARGCTPKPLTRLPRSQFGNPLGDEPASFLAHHKPARFRIANPPVNRIKCLLVFGLRNPRLAHKNHATPSVADTQPLRPAIPADSPVQTQWAQPGKERQKHKRYNESPEYFATHNGINSRTVARGTTSPRREARLPRSIAASVSRSSSA